MLVLPPKPPNAGVSRGFHDRDPKHLAAYLAMRALALPSGDVDEGLICHCFDKSISQEVQRQAARADCFSLGHPLLNLGVGKSRVRTNGAIIDERAARDAFASVSYGDVRISETPLGSSMSHSQLRDLARPTRCRILVALAAGLRVVEGAEAVIHCFGFIEFLFVGLVGGIVKPCRYSCRRSPAGASEEGGGSEAKAKATPTIAAA